MLTPFLTLAAIAAPLPVANVDTDKILAGRFLKTITRTGLGKALFSAIRYDEFGGERPEFILNRDPWRQAGILITGDNFGCGSSREHAPWALLDFGIRCIIAPSFADIFYNNCFKNGILPILLEPNIVRGLWANAACPAEALMVVDLPSQTIRCKNGDSFAFEIDADRKAALLTGRDEIAETMLSRRSIADWEKLNCNSFAKEILLPSAAEPS